MSTFQIRPCVSSTGVSYEVYKKIEWENKCLFFSAWKHRWEEVEVYMPPESEPTDRNLIWYSSTIFSLPKSERPRKLGDFEEAIRYTFGVFSTIEPWRPTE